MLLTIRTTHRPATAFEWVLWAHARPGTIVLTTPNAGVADRNGYTVRFSPVDPENAEVGAPTQMAVFTRVD